VSGLNILASGELTNDPQSRKAASGKAYTIASLRVRTEGESMLVSIICFDSEAQTLLGSMHRGDPACVTGRGKLSSWMGRDGVEHHGLSCVAERVMAMHWHKRGRKERAHATEQDFPDDPL